jgi:sialidase-1
MDIRLVSSLLLVLLLLLTGVSAAQTVTQSTADEDTEVIGSPEIELSPLDNRLQPGQTQTVEIQVSNAANIRKAGPSDLERRVKTARNLRYEVRERNLPEPLDLRSGPVLAGSLPEGLGEPIRFTFDVSDGIDSGTYRIPVTVSYDYTRLAERDSDGVTRYRDFSAEETVYVEMVVEDDAYFSVESVRSDVVAGDTGEYVLRVENIGTRAARNPRVVATVDETGVFFGGLDQRLPSRTAGTETNLLEPGQTGFVRMRAGAGSEVTAGTYPVDATVRYETRNGVTRETNPATVSLRVADEQDFAVENVDSSLRVGEDGDLTGTLRNRGPNNVTNAVVVFNPENQNVNPRQPEYSVGDLEVGETATFDYRVAVSSEAEGGPRLSSVVVEYRNPGGDRSKSEPVDVSYDVADERDEFALRSNVTIGAGSSTVAEVEVTNVKNETVRNIQARMFTDDPLSDGGDESYVQRLEPGETTTVSFDITASGGATPKTYAATVDFRYDDSENESQISDTYRVPVEVTSSGGQGGGNSILPIVVLLIGAGAAWWKRDAIREAIGR